MQIKRTLAFVDDVAIEAGQPVTPPLRKVAVVAIFDNPFAGKFEKDLSPLTEASEEIGRHISRMAIALLAPHKPESYGKGAVIGINGEQEHGVAMLTTVFWKRYARRSRRRQSMDFLTHQTCGAGRKHRRPVRTQGCALRAVAL